MARYLIQASYTGEAKSAFASNPQDRMPAVKALVERLEGKLECLYFCIGDDDVIAITELPDDISAVAVSIAAAAPGHLASFKTTKLLTSDEMVEAMRKASKQSFEGPKRR